MPNGFMLGQAQPERNLSDPFNGYSIRLELVERRTANMSTPLTYLCVPNGD